MTRNYLDYVPFAPRSILVKSMMLATSLMFHHGTQKPNLSEWGAA